MDLLVQLADKFLIDGGHRCWPWTACRGGNGYGQISRHGRMQPAHRVMYELLVGPIPPGMQIDHLCTNRACVRPDHLQPVDSATNTTRGRSMINPGEASARIVSTHTARGSRNKTHCVHGHPLSGDNLILHASGRRKCRQCRKQHQTRYNLKHPERYKRADGSRYQPTDETRETRP